MKIDVRDHLLQLSLETSSHRPNFQSPDYHPPTVLYTSTHTHPLGGWGGGGQSLVVEVGNSCLMSCRGHQEASQVPQPDRMTGGNTSLSVTVTNCHLRLPSIVQDKETFESKAFPSAKDTQSERHFFELKCSLLGTSCRQSVITYQNSP